MTPRLLTLDRREDVAAGANVHIDVLDARTGAVLRRISGHNIVTDGGLGWIAARLAGAVSTPTHLALGSDDTPATAADVALGNELARPVLADVTANGPEMVAQYYMGSSAFNTLSFAEAALYAGTTMVARFVFDVPGLQPKTNAVAAVFTWTLTFARV